MVDDREWRDDHDPPPVAFLVEVRGTLNPGRFGLEGFETKGRLELDGWHGENGGLFIPHRERITHWCHWIPELRDQFIEARKADPRLTLDAFGRQNKATLTELYHVRRHLEKRDALAAGGGDEP